MVDFSKLKKIEKNKMLSIQLKFLEEYQNLKE